MRMTQRRDGSRLVLDALALPSRECLDRNGPAQASVDGLVHLAHATRAQCGENFVRAETGAGGQRHCGKAFIIAIRDSRPLSSAINHSARLPQSTR